MGSSVGRWLPRARPLRSVPGEGQLWLCESSSNLCKCTHTSACTLHITIHTRTHTHVSEMVSHIFPEFWNNPHGHHTPGWFKRKNIQNFSTKTVGNPQSSSGSDFFKWHRGQVGPDTVLPQLVLRDAETTASCTLVGPQSCTCHAACRSLFSLPWPGGGGGGGDSVRPEGRLVFIFSLPWQWVWECELHFVREASWLFSGYVCGC